MNNSSKKYTEHNNIKILHARSVWLHTLIASLIVILGLLGFAYDAGSGISIEKLVRVHKEYIGLFIFDGLPLYVYIILSLSGKKMYRQIILQEDKAEKYKDILEKNSAFAKALSEGDVPESFPEILETDLGKALKLVELNIRGNRRKEKEIAWITEGKDIISRLLRIHNDLDETAYQVLIKLNKYINAVQGAVYIYAEEKKVLKNVATYAYNSRKFINQEFQIGQGLVGQCAFEMDYIYRTEIPDDYVTITSGIPGDQKPQAILLVPLLTNEQIQGVIEFAFIEERIPKLTIQFVLELGGIIARTIYNLSINEKTRLLLEESRKLTEDLQENELKMQENAKLMQLTQDQLQQANNALQKKMEETANAQNRLHCLLDNASEIISIYDESLILNYISPSVENILGYSPDEMMTEKDFERIDQAGSIAIRKAFNQLKINPELTVQIEYTYTKKDGKRLHLSSTIRNLLHDPSIQGYIFNTRDITESKLIEKEQRLKTRMQSLSENSPDLILRINKSGTIHYVNPVIKKYSDISPGQVMNRTLGEVAFSKILKSIIENALHTIIDKPVKYSLEELIAVKEGENKKEKTILFNMIPEFLGTELESLLIVGHDITESKRIEKEIKITHKKIQDSITYANRIQSSILPSMQNIQKAFPESFIYYKPKDIISGDFPWYYETEQAWYIAAVDCTGHGVPGALLSFIGFFLLNNLTALNANRSAGEICDLFNNEVRKTLKQDQNNPETTDGMDMAFCKILKKKNKLEFVGAHRPLYLLREGEIIVYKGERKAVGGLIHSKMPQRPFTNNEVNLRKGDKLFIFSDGMTDQLGGPKGEKYSPARLRNVLLENRGFTIQQFNRYFKNDFQNWLGKEQQIDDVLMIGIGF